MDVEPDHGEDSYRGTGRLSGKRAVITGGDSGIGRAVAIAFAREGADVLIAYLPEEEDDARETAQLIEKAGRKAVTVPGDIRDEAHRTGIVAFTEALGANLAEKGIRVNAVAPGLTRWVTFRSAFIEGNERGMRGYADGNPFERSPS